VVVIEVEVAITWRVPAIYRKQGCKNCVVWQIELVLSLLQQLGLMME
jgi:hypothetical protein